MVGRESHTLSVPGAAIYYERRGTGPLALFIPGGPQDAGVFTDIAHRLSDRYTVITFDPRGNSRTVTDSVSTDLDVDILADDAAALIRANGGGPAVVFGTSGGAQIGLNLAARYPALITTLIAHEAPTMLLLPAPESALASDRALYDTYLKHGVEAAMGQFFAENGLAGDDDVPPTTQGPEDEATFGRVTANFEYWLAHGMLPLSTYRPDVETLARGKPRIVVAIGKLSVDQPIAAMSRALADQLGVVPVEFPGDHMGFGPEAERFAQRLDAVFTTEPPSESEHA